MKQYRTAIILCGGKGTRLGSLSKKTPKTLIKIQNKAIIWYIINILKINKFNHLILPIGFRGEHIKNFLKKNFKNEKNIEVFKTGENSSIASRIFKIKKYIMSNDFLLLNGDAIFNFNLNKIYKNHLKKKNIMTFISFSFQADFGTITIKKNKVIGFQRNLNFNYVKSKNNKNLKSYIYSGISIMNKKTLNKNFKEFKNFEKELYPSIIKKHKCDLKVPNGFFASVDNVKDISKLNSKNFEDSKYTKVQYIKELILNYNKKND